MTEIEPLVLEIKVYDGEEIRARRKDRKRLTDADRTEVWKVVDSQPELHPPM